MVIGHFFENNDNRLSEIFNEGIFSMYIGYVFARIYVKQSVLFYKSRITFLKLYFCIKRDLFCRFFNYKEQIRCKKRKICEFKEDFILKLSESVQL